jgi:putative molybdopterin biosynthesis protein
MEEEPPAQPSAQTLRFVGSHDPAITLIAARFSEIAPGATFRPLFSGSLGGLIALAEGKADLSGCHLWDEETDSYNAPFVRRLLPGARVRLVTLAHRRLGLLVAPHHQNRMSGLGDLTQDLRFVNRQRGAGTRVWLDAQLRRAGIRTESIRGYDREAATHSEVARLIAEDSADVGLGVEAAALVFGLGFIPLTLERYDLIVPEATWATSAIQSLTAWLPTPSARAAIRSLGGYDTRETGEVSVVDEAPRTSPQTR